MSWDRGIVVVSPKPPPLCVVIRVEISGSHSLNQHYQAILTILHNAIREQEIIYSTL